MRPVWPALVGAVALAFPASALTRATNDLTVRVCGDASLRVALPLDRKPPEPDQGECGKACHLGSCRRRAP